MSVINQMLNDIEQREKQSSQPPNKLDVLEVTEPSSSKMRVMIIVLLFLSLVLGLWLFQGTIEQIEPEVSTNVEKLPVAKPTVPTKTSPDKLVTSIDVPNVDKELVADDSKPAAVKPQSFLPRSKLVVTSPLDGSAAEKMQESVSEVVEKTVVEPNEPVAEVVQAKSVAVKKKPQLSIEPVALTPLQVAQLKYQQGLKQQNAGRLQRAQQSWRASLSAQPDFHQARESLAASYYGANDSGSALALLQQGSRDFPLYEGYRLLTAQILFSAKQPQQALAALNKPYMNPQASDQALSLAGSIAQSLESWPQAELNFQRLVSRNSSNSKWLIGLAIAFDAQQKSTQAIKAYQQFLALPNVEKSLYQYAKGRLSQLKTQSQTREQHGQS